MLCLLSQDDLHVDLVSAAPAKRGLTRGRTESVKDLLGSQMIRTPEPRYLLSNLVLAEAFFLTGQFRAALRR